jgi:hypothetical protein
MARSDCWNIHRDLAQISSKDPVVRRGLADQIRDACLNVGFLYGKDVYTSQSSAIAHRLQSKIMGYQRKSHGML